MKYAIWFVRLVFAAWMIPAGLNHFYPIFPQPMGSQPLSHELIVALIDSHLFDLVKAVELLAGLALLTGRHAPLALLVCMPVSFCVFWWDAPLEGWGSRAALFGYSVLACNLILCFAYIGSYRAMFAWSPRPGAIGRIGSKALLLPARLLFGAWMLANGLNHFLLGAWPEPAGHAPHATQLMDAFVHSGLLDVAMTIELVAGALILLGRFTPVALCVLMPVSTCALFWAAVLDHQLFGTLIALTAFVLNGLLMLGYLDCYRSALQRRAVTIGETAGTATTYDSLFASFDGRTPRSHFVPALIVLLAVAAFYAYLVTGRTAAFCVQVLIYPGLVLHARRLQDMGRSASLLVVPVVLLLVAFAIRLDYRSFGAGIDGALPVIALVVAAGFALWGALGRSRGG
jgi:uncharacterized membrane protein YphA (DoxX/SURF4 family)/uncharacterized membrane protein YhaH (DUF805 family)